MRAASNAASMPAWPAPWQWCVFHKGMHVLPGLNFYKSTGNAQTIPCSGTRPSFKSYWHVSNDGYFMLTPAWGHLLDTPIEPLPNMVSRIEHWIHPAHHHLGSHQTFVTPSWILCLRQEWQLSVSWFFKLEILVCLPKFTWLKHYHTYAKVRGFGTCKNRTFWLLCDQSHNRMLWSHRLMHAFAEWWFEVHNVSPAKSTGFNNAAFWNFEFCVCFDKRRDGLQNVPREHELWYLVTSILRFITEALGVRFSQFSFFSSTAQRLLIGSRQCFQIIGWSTWCMAWIQG